MYQNYPNFYQPTQTTNRPAPIQQQIPQQPSFLKGRLVASVEEVRATPIDFDGSVFFFPDLANKKIYTKQINLDGTAQLNMYELKSMPIVVNENNVTYITREEFEESMNNIKSILGKIQIPNNEETSNSKTPSDAQMFNF